MENPSSPDALATTATDHAFSTAEQAAVYRAIHSRRDVRGQFLPTPIPDAVLSRLLLAAHHAPSVGFMQPWNFIVVRDPAVKGQIKALFDQANGEAAARFPDERRALYSRFKLEGIVEAPINLVITCDRQRSGPVVIGRTHMPEMDLFSSVCAVQNLWLAARAEGLGVGWVSIFDPEAVQRVLGIPPHIFPVAYLCLGEVSHFKDRPELESAGWLPRLPVEELVYFDQWQQSRPDDSLIAELVDQRQALNEALNPSRP